MIHEVYNKNRSRPACTSYHCVPQPDTGITYSFLGKNLPRSPQLKLLESSTPEMKIFFLVLALLLFGVLLSPASSIKLPSDTPKQFRVKERHDCTRTAARNLFLRQATTTGKCPSQDLDCPIDGFCCDGYCCSSRYPNCIEGSCIDGQGQVPCGPAKEPGTSCGDETCCEEADFPNCPVDLNVPTCLTDDGYINCGGAPGVICNVAQRTCCQNPDRCCSTSASGCCATGSGQGPFAIKPTLSGSPGVTPQGGTGKPSDSPTSPAPSPKPSVTPQTPDQTQPPDTTPSTPSTTPPTTTTADTQQQFPQLPDGSGNDDDGVCFPADATVELEDGSVKTMEELQTGDRVRVSADSFSEVFMWTHRDSSYRKDNYIRVVSQHGHSLTATVGHLVYYCKQMQSDCAKESVLIEDLEEGDGLWMIGTGAKVQAVKIVEKRRVVSRGLYNPQTLHGDIVVNGALSTCYTRFIPFRGAHGSLAPLRALYKVAYRLTGRKLNLC